MLKKMRENFMSGIINATAAEDGGGSVIYSLTATMISEAWS